MIPVPAVPKNKVKVSKNREKIQKLLVVLFKVYIYVNMEV